MKWSEKVSPSPDTEVYYIGLPLVVQTSLEVMVELSPFTSLELKYADVQALFMAFANDPDFALISQFLSFSAIHVQMLYVCTGWNLISSTDLAKAHF